MVSAASTSEPRNGQGSSSMRGWCRGRPTAHDLTRVGRGWGRRWGRGLGAVGAGWARWARDTELSGGTRRRGVGEFNLALEALDDRDVGGAAALAHRLQAVAAADALELVEHRREQLGPGGPERMPERDRAAVRVDLLGVGLDVLEPGHDNRGEGLVDLHDVDVVDRQAGLLQCKARGRDRAG